VALVVTGAGTPQGNDLAVDAGHVFCGTAGQVAVALQQAFIGVVNPVGSGKTVWIDKIEWELAAAGIIEIHLSDSVQGAVNNFQNPQKAGGAAGVATGRSGNKVPQFGGTLLVQGEDAVNNDSRAYQPPYPLELPPGTGCYIIRQLINAVLDFANFYWREY